MADFEVEKSEALEVTKNFLEEEEVAANAIPNARRWSVISWRSCACAYTRITGRCAANA